MRAPCLHRVYLPIYDIDHLSQPVWAVSALESYSRNRDRNVTCDTCRSGRYFARLFDCRLPAEDQPARRHF